HQIQRRVELPFSQVDIDEKLDRRECVRCAIEGLPERGPRLIETLQLEEDLPLEHSGLFMSRETPFDFLVHRQRCFEVALVALDLRQQEPGLDRGWALFDNP